MSWMRLEMFDCPVCDQRLAVQRGQARRYERVTCNRCNTDFQLAPKGGTDVPPVAEAREMGYVIQEVPV